MKYVICPVCKGSKKSPNVTWMTCGCCKGEGKITEQLAKFKKQIKKDLTARLLGV